MVSRWHRLVLTGIAAVVLAAVTGLAMPTGTASAEDTPAATAPAPPEGYTLVSQDDLAAKNLPAGAIELGLKTPTADTVKPAPPGYVQVVRKSCITVTTGIQTCSEFVFGVPEGGPEVGQPTSGAAPVLPEIGTGTETGGTFGYNDACERMNPSSPNMPVPLIGRLVQSTLENTCKVTNVVTHPGDALQKMWDSEFGKTVKSLIAGVADGWGTMLNWFFNQASPALANAQYLDILQSYFLPVQAVLLVMSVILACIRIVLAQSGTETAAATDLMRTLVRTIVSVGLFGTGLTLAIQMADAFSVWLITASGGTDLSTKVDAMLLSDNSTWGPGWVLIIALFGMAGAFIQTVLLVVRQAFLMVIVGVLPLAAAASSTEIGSSSYEKMRNWAIAFVLLKPAVAAVMAVAFWAADPGSDVARLQGLILLTVAAVAMPALLRMMNVSTSGGGSGMMGAAAGLAGGAALAAAGGVGLAAGVAGKGATAAVGASGRSFGGATGIQSGGGAAGAAGGGGGGGGAGGGGGGAGGGARQRSSVGTGSSPSGPRTSSRRPSFAGNSMSRQALRAGVQTARAGAARSGSALDRMAHDIASDSPGRPYPSGRDVLR